MRTIQVPGVGPIKFPDTMSDAEIALAIERDILPTIKPPETGIGAALVGGTKRAVSTAQTALESIFDAEGAARRGLAREEEISRQYAPGANLEAVKRAYAERGLLPAAGEVVSQIPAALAEQFPNIAATLGGAKAGAMAGARRGPMGALIGAGVGAAAPSLFQQYGSNIQRQAEEGQDISRGAALAAAVPQAALDVASTFIPLGRSVAGKLLGPDIEKALAKGTNEAVERAAKESLGKTLGKGVLIGAGVEGGTEVAQQMLERLQAGLPLTTPDALEEYGQAAYGGALPGAPFGGLGRVASRSVARGQVEEKAAAERRIQEQIAEQERVAAEKAEAARLTSPEYRLELIGKISEAEDRLKQVEPIAKDKTVDEDVRKEAVDEANALKKQLKEYKTSLKNSMKEAGLASTLAEEIKARPREMPVVDEFGNIVKPKGEQLTEEEYGQKLEGAARKWDETREKIFALREKEELQLQAKKDKVAAKVDQQVKTYLRSLDEYDNLIEQEKVAKGLKAREKATKEEIQQRALDRIQKVIDNFGLNLLGFKSSEEIQSLKKQIADAERPEAVAAAPDRAAYLQQLNTLKAQLQKAIDEAPRDTGEGLQRLVNEGIVTRDVTKALGIEGLEGRTYRDEDASKSLPNIQAAIDKLEEKRQKATAAKQELMRDDGQLTDAGMQLVRNEIKLNELKRLQGVIQSRKPAETAGEAAMTGLLQTTAKTQEAPAVEIEPDKPSGVYKKKAEDARRQATGNFTDLTAFMDDYRRGRFFGRKGAKRDVELASSTRAELLSDTEEARKNVIDGLITEIAYERKLQGLRPFTRDEAIKLAIDVDAVLEELINRSIALPSGYFLERVVLDSAQMRSNEIVKAAKDTLRDVRDLKDRQFGAPQRAVEVLAETIKQARDDAIAAGKRPVRKGEFGLAMAPRKAAPTDLVKDLDRVLRMENLQPDVRDTLEAARRRMEEGGVSEGLEDLVEEQVGRILRGTDRPFVLEPDVTKPGGRRTMAAAGTAELVDEIKTQMRFDAQQRQYAEGEQMAVVPKGREFREVRTQAEMFPETVATERATPTQFQRLQKSAEVRKKQQQIEQTKEKANQMRREAREAAADFEREISTENIQDKKLDLLGKIQSFMQETTRQIDTATFKTPSDLMEKLESNTNRALLSRLEQLAKDLNAEEGTFEISTEGFRLTWLPDNTLRKWATLDEDIAQAFKKVRDLEATAKKAAKGSLEQQKAKALAAKQRGMAVKVAQQRAKAAEQLAKKANAFKQRVMQGLGLPGFRAIAKTREEVFGDLMKARKEAKTTYKKALAEYKALSREEQKVVGKPEKQPLKRPSKFNIVPIKSKAEIDAEVAVRRQEQLDDIRRRARVSSPESMYDRLKEDEKTAIENVKEKEQQLKKFNAQFPALQKLKAKETVAEQTLNKTKVAVDNLTVKKQALDNKVIGLEEDIVKEKAALLRFKKDSSAYAEQNTKVQTLKNELQQAQNNVKAVETAIKKAQTKTSLAREIFYDKKEEISSKPQKLQMGEAKFNEFKKLSAEVDLSKEILKSIRSNLRLVAETQYIPETERRRKPTRGLIGGEVKWFDKKFTPDQLRKMSGMGLSAFDGTKTYSVDDNIDFRIGDTEGGGIDLNEAEARIKNVIKKLDGQGKTGPDMTRRRLIQGMGAAIATPKMPASLMRAFSKASVDADSLYNALSKANSWLDAVIENTFSPAVLKNIDFYNLRQTKVYKALKSTVNEEAARYVDAFEYADGAYLESVFDAFLQTAKNDPAVLEKIQRAYDVATTNIFKDIAAQVKTTEQQIQREEKALEKINALTTTTAPIKFIYFPTMGDVTLDILNDMERQGVDVYKTRIRGGVKPDGTVFVIGENHTDMLDLEKTIAHEFVGHYTFEGMLGEKGMENLMLKADKAFATKKNENGLENLAKDLGVLDDYAEAVASTGKFYADQLAKGEITEKEVRRLAKTKGLREIIAYTMEKRVDENFLQKAKRWIQELVGAFRAALRNMGLLDAANMSTSDLFYMMKQANKAFEEGKPIAYKKADGDIDFRFSKPKYNAGLEDLGAMTDKIIGRQQGMWNSIKANTMGLAGRVQFVDRWAALEELGKRGVSKGIINSLEAQDMMYFARMTDQRHSLVAEIANNGGLKLKDIKRPDGRMEKIIESDRGASLKDISQALISAGVGNAEATGRLFTLYLAAERAQRVGIEKLNFGKDITRADLDKALAFGRNNKAFQKARELYNEYNKGLVDFAVQTGAISKEEGTRLSKTNDYVPFYRMRGGNVELIIGSENPIRIGDVKNQPYLKELVGGDEAIMDFFTSSLQNTTLLTDMALRNLATRNAAFTLANLGVAEIHRGDGPSGSDVIHFKMESFDKKKNKVVHGNMWAKINTKSKEELFGDIPSDLVVKGMEGIQVIVPGLTRMMGAPANWVRKFVTRDPRYAVRQIFRDSLAATLTTGANIKPVLDTVNEIVKMYGKGSEAFEKLQRRGILGGQVITGAPEDMAKILQQIASGKPGWDLAMAKLDALALKGDAGTRLALYNAFLKQGLSEREASLGALESMNFGRRGVSPSIYFLNATIPFFNAGIQGIDVLYRAFTKQMPYEQQLQVKKKLLMRGSTMALLTLAYAAMMQDDEAYKNAEPEQRYGNWFVRIPGVKEPFRVPIPFEVGLLFKSVPEGIYNAMFSSEKGEKVAKDLVMQTVRSLPGNLAEAGVPIPVAFKPFIEVATNMSLFTGRDIVDARLEKLDKSMQYKDKTPELIKLLGQYTHFRIGNTEIGFSPVQLEHITRTLTGSLGIGVASILNPVLRTGAEAGEVEGRLTDVPIVGGMFQPNDAGRVINDAYETVKMVEKKQNTYKALIAEGKIEEAQDYLKKNVGEVGLASYAGAFRQQMGQITKAERAIKAAPETQMSPEKKREELDKFRKLKIQMSEQFKTVREQIERQAARP